MTVIGIRRGLRLDQKGKHARRAEVRFRNVCKTRISRDVRRETLDDIFAH